jgi:putative ABC transport system permease protein
MGIWSDLRLGFRLLRSRPGFTAIAVFTLALGISVTTAMFGVLDTMYWKAFPGAAAPGRLVELETVAPDGSMVQGSWLHFREYREGLRPTAAVAAHVDAGFTLGGPDHGKAVRGELVSANFFDVLGVKPGLGRVFGTEERSEAPGANPAVVISHALWVEEFQGSRDILGKTLRVNRRELTVIGVTPPEFRGAMDGTPCSVWVPFTMSVALGVKERESFTDPALRNLYMFARLGRGVGLAQAQAQAAAIAQRLAAASPAHWKGFGATVEPMWRSRLHGRAAFLRPMLILLAVSLLVLAIVCANVANLLLARSVARMGEYGVRTVLGATRARLARQCLIETLLLAVPGALLGVPLCLWMTDSASLLLPKLARPGSTPIEMDWRMLAFAFLICLAAAFASSTAAIVFVGRSRLDETLRMLGRMGSAGARSHRLRNALVVGEVAIAMVVLIGAGLFFRAHRNLSSVDPGFDRKGVLLANVPIASGGYSVEELQRLCLRLRERLEPAPGIAAVAYADYAPLWATDGPYHTIEPEGFVSSAPEDLKAHRTSVSPGYFGLLRIPLLEGRDFSESDDAGAAQVMIVDQAFARKYYGGASPVGRRVMVRKRWRTIVGLARDSKYFSFTEASRPHFYLPFRQWYLPGSYVLFFVRAKGEAEAAVPALREAASAIDPGAAGFTAAPLAEHNALLLMPMKLATSLLAALGAIALALAGVGLYGVISFTVSQRTRELGIRIALGAKPREVLGAVAREALALTCGGVVCGLAVAALSMRLLSEFLAGVSPFDPATFAAAALFLVVVAGVASVAPAARATRIQPISALRSE